MKSNDLISIVIPVFNEEGNLQELYAEVKTTMDSLGREWELLFVDDGSTDKTLEILKELKKENDKIKIISFQTNFGQTSALMAGFKNSKGELIITMDGDLQNDPADIPHLIKELDKGSDVVSGWRKERKEPLLTRRLPSFIANRLISAVSGVRLHDYGCTLKVYRKEAVDNLNLYGEMHRFIPALLGNMGYKISEVEVSHHARKHGRSKYNLSRVFRVVLDLLTVKFAISYQTQPIYLFGGLGIILSFVGFAIFTYLSYIKFFMGETLSDRPLFLVSIFFMLVGIQMITIGLVTEMLIRVYYESQNKDPYLIKEKII